MKYPIKSYQKIKDNLQLLYFGSTYQNDLQNFFSTLALHNIGLLDNVNEYLKNDDFISAGIQNDQINPQNLFEANTKRVNEIVILNSKDTIGFDSIQHADLISIAYQLPIVGGPAVYRARAILKLDVDDSQLAYRIAGNQPAKSKNRFVIYPNPTTGEVSLMYALDRTENGHAVVYSSLGQPLIQSDLNSEINILNFNLSSYPDGIYYITLDTSSGYFEHWIVILAK